MNQILFFVPPALALLAGCQPQTVVTEEAQAQTSPAVAKAGAEQPVVLELFQSQGCSSCPPANAALNAVADRNDLIALNFSVTYWDRLGWKDIFGDKAYTQRQYDYAAGLGGANVYTPQVVINGARAIVGNRPSELSRAIASSKPVSGGPSIKRDGNRVAIGSGKGSADIWLVRYDSSTQNVPIRSGENGGRILPHKNIVRQLDRIGKWNGAPAQFTLAPAKNSKWRPVILVQRNNGGAILSAKKI